jgi:hypothetical protein
VKGARGDADVAHAEGDRGEPGILDQAEDAEVVERAVGDGGQLDHVGVQPGQPGVDFLEVVRGAAEVVVADDALGLAVARNLSGDVLLEVDVLDSRRDGASQKHQPLLLGAGVLAAVPLAANGHHHGRGPVLQEPCQVHFALQVIEAQLNELRALFHEVPVLGDHRAVPPAANAHADHAVRRKARG